MIPACPPGQEATPYCPPPWTQGAPCPPGMPVAQPFPTPEVQGDEYVCDGGDEYPRAHLLYGEIKGVGLEDTVGAFTDEEGVVHLRPSTKTCIYTPRFAAVRTVTAPQLDLAINRASGHHDRYAVGALEARAVIDEKRQADEARGLLMRSRASGVEAKAGDGLLDQAVKANSHVKLAGPHEDLRFIQQGQFDRVSQAVIDLGVDAAIEWSAGRRPVVVAKDIASQTIIAHASVKEFVGTEDRRKPGDLRVIKLADKASAHPGEIVTFTIRIENPGEKDLFEVRLVDHLSPRLEFVDGSVNSDLDGQITNEFTEAGGQMLTFQFDNPLPAGGTGFVSFQTRVR